MEVNFQQNFEQYETWKGVDIVPDYAEGDFLHFKITDAKRQIKVKIHKRHFAMFVDSMGQTEVNFISSNVPVSGSLPSTHISLKDEDLCELLKQIDTWSRQENRLMPLEYLGLLKEWLRERQ